ncbi:hypothetical protein AAV35_013765 (plasmid) [Salimicrobium jeotgali]|uniref:GNAT family acetyltransferase n=1 Tax=Salimicrobium jeotgali TaxID=1230341 RepID=K2FI90_9BACI|nr:GNAT family N-acetyltransferase [Salimicrobium jeotgali]AKG05841.1 hypothetical protein AAV35_013765 [Salimicrobium jeotgali]EKE30796.1 GNAT family acetyltransferase [Salimicrobium jeotgali]MBM7697605.1 GNAT superfamily N-acetyltransferase [Salimicrobium jeotgali]
MRQLFNSKIINGSPDYLIIEEIGELKGTHEFEQLIAETMKFVVNKNIKKVSIVLNNQEALNTSYLEYLEKRGFFQHEIQYFYYRNLEQLHISNELDSISLSSLKWNDEYLFKKIWEQSMVYSLNAPSQTTIERQFEGMKSEIGNNYKGNCLTISKNNIPIGVTIPHIEQGKLDEGRIFYFGLLPEYRGKGLGRLIHKKSLQYLKQLKAGYYIGSTGHKNHIMQNVFKDNNCKFFDERITYQFLGNTADKKK